MGRKEGLSYIVYVTSKINCISSIIWLLAAKEVKHSAHEVAAVAVLKAGETVLRALVMEVSSRCGDILATDLLSGVI